MTGYIFFCSVVRYFWRGPSLSSGSSETSRILLEEMEKQARSDGKEGEYSEKAVPS